MDAAFGLLAVAALIMANGYFVAAEFAFVAVNQNRLDELAEGGDRRAQRAVAVTRRLSFVLSGAQLGITVTSLVVGFIAEPAFGAVLRPLFEAAGVPAAAAFGLSLTVGFVVATAAQMVFGELGPKNLAIAEPERLALALARSTWLYTTIAGPVIRLFDGSANRLLRLVGIEPVEHLSSAVSPEELGHIIDESHREGSLAAAQAALLSRALEFRSLRAGDAMVARPTVEWLSLDATCADLAALANATGHSRFPVAGDGLDDVKGIVEAKDLFRVPLAVRDRTLLRTLLQPVLAVPESALLTHLLADMREAHTQVAIVVDEHGGTAGIVTLEDIVEELVGNIQDEYDVAEPMVQRLPDGAFRLPGGWRLDEVDRDCGVQLPDGDYDTVSGLVMERLGRVPQVGDVVRVAAGELIVESLDGLAVGRVRLVPAGRPDLEDDR